MNKILSIINGSSKQCSLRLVDWFVTNYARVHNTIITNRINHNIVHFNVYLSYRSQLKAYSKQQFDPFRRRERILFFYERDKSVETTIGQLNFFRWILQNNLLEYIVSHQADIEQDMITQQRLQKASQSISTEPSESRPISSTPISTVTPSTPQAQHPARSSTPKPATVTKPSSSSKPSSSLQRSAKKASTNNKKPTPSAPTSASRGGRKKSKHQAATINMNQLGGVRMIMFD